jgi:Protein of unknown function (DUF2911)
MQCMNVRFALAVSVLLVAGSGMTAGANSNATTICNFDADKRLTVEYQAVSFDAQKKVFGKEIPYGKVFAPGGKPMTMFTNTPVMIGGKELPIGAYTLFLIPEPKAWTLVISKSADTSGKYDEQHDLLRVPMQFGELPHAEPQFSVYMGHVAADQCSMRIDLRDDRAWIAFTEGK